MVIGVTGGVGAGKSTVLELLQNEFGAHLLIADDIVRDLMNPGKSAYQAVAAHFGPDILSGVPDENGDYPIDRPRLASLVFADEKKLSELNALTHPLGRQAIEQEIALLQAADPECLIILEAALLFESGYYMLCDKVWAIVTDPECRYQRLKESRGYSREKTDSVMKNQMTDKEFISRADDVINNSGDLEDTRAQIAVLLAKYA